jgi:hypothetical protein
MPLTILKQPRDIKSTFSTEIESANTATKGFIEKIYNTSLGTLLSKKEETINTVALFFAALNPEYWKSKGVLHEDLLPMAVAEATKTVNAIITEKQRLGTEEKEEIPKGFHP